MNDTSKYPALLRMQDVADRLNASLSWAYQLARREEFPVVRIGRAVRVREKDLEAFIRTHVQGASKDDE